MYILCAVSISKEMTLIVKETQEETVVIWRVFLDFFRAFEILVWREWVCVLWLGCSQPACVFVSWK